MVISLLFVPANRELTLFFLHKYSMFKLLAFGGIAMEVGIVKAPTYIVLN
jgi:hypothetical protein